MSSRGEARSLGGRDVFSGGQTMLACRVGQRRDIKFEGTADYVSHVIKTAQTNCGLFLHVDITNGMADESWPETELDQVYGLLGAKA